MKSLLIDNYDSFTYNLSQLWTAVTGSAPTLIRNDEWERWNALRLADFDAVLISPGPGRPDHRGDFGISRAVLDSGRPLLGVCLGHQGICLAAGARIVAAPEPVHGRSSPISHNGTGLFAGIASPFDAVRYHSLVAADLPPELTVTATTPDPDGQPIVMAVEHRAKPQWGVQFHPESIASEHGHQLLANFATLAQAGRRITAGPHSPIAGEDLSVQALRISPAGPYELIIRRVEHEPDPAELFTTLFGDDPHGYWMDGATAPPDPGSEHRISILGGAGPLGERITAVAGTGVVSVERMGQPITDVPGDVFGYLSEQLAARSLPATGLPFEFALGWVGYLGYELKADSGGDRAHQSDLPDAALLFTDRAVVIDHTQGRTWLLALAFEGAGPSSDQTGSALGQTAPAGPADVWLDQAEAAVRAAPAPSVVSKPAAAEPLPAQWRHSPEKYRGLIGECQRLIRAGETYEVNLTNELVVDVDVDPLAAFRTLRAVSPAPCAAFLRTGTAAVLSASPERFLRITAAGQVQTRPIKGTRRRGTDPMDDAQQARELAHSVKDRAENLMIVDLLRNDLGSVAVPGSVVVPRLFALESFAAVHQLVSTVEAQLETGLTAADCVRAAFPGGSMTGAPKRRTMQIIDRLEAGPRGVYSGALGWFSLTGAAELSVVIRTLVVHPGRVTLGAGGAVTALSDPAEELAEMLLKAQAPLDALAMAVQSRTTTPRA